jgi:hypothetical protein
MLDLGMILAICYGIMMVGIGSVVCGNCCLIVAAAIICLAFGCHIEALSSETYRASSNPKPFKPLRHPRSLPPPPTPTSGPHVVVGVEPLCLTVTVPVAHLPHSDALPATDVCCLCLQL